MGELRVCLDFVPILLVEFWRLTTATQTFFIVLNGKRCRGPITLPHHYRSRPRGQRSPARSQPLGRGHG